MANDGQRNLWKWIGIAILGIFVIIQFIPVDKTNPPVSQEIATPPQVKSIMEKSCFDCHSNKTQWPWYSSVAPASWLVAHDVHEAREHINFSTWDQYSTGDQLEIIEEVWEEVKEGEMPLWYYTIAHPKANLSEEEKQALHSWVSEMTSKTSIDSEQESMEMD